MSDNKKLDEALADILPHLRDVSLRDGIQSWDGNRWRIDDILPVAREINELARVASDELGVKIAPAEVWGGGQVFQPALFLKEDPFRNLEKLKEAMPDVELQSLYRGRQGYAFKPLSDEVQREAIKESADRGIQVFRIFDMMNDPENVETGIKALVDYKNAHPEKGIRIEGAVSYISEPEGKPRAWTLEEYGDYAVKLAKMGADEIVIKNYAGVGDKEMPDLVKTIHAKLEEASCEPGFERLAEMKINLHSHGHKPKVFAKVLAAGADKVDVAIGELSDGPAHTNMRDVIMTLLKEKGVTDFDAINAHPVMKQLARVEARIHDVVHREQEFTVNGQTATDTFENRRGMLKNLDPEDIERYRVAQGALSDLAARVKGQDPRLFGQVLEKASALWDRAGRFNTVTPGAKIIIDQAVKLTLQQNMRRPASMDDYDDEFIKVVTGRFGRNQGMEKGVGDVAWRDALLMYKALKVLNNAVADREIDTMKYQSLISLAGFGGPGHRPVVRSGVVDVKDPGLEAVLMKNSESTINRFRKVVTEAALPGELKAQLLDELTPGRSPTPKEGLAEGAKVVKQMEEQGIEVPPYGALMTMLLRNGNDNIVRSVFGASGHAASLENAQATQRAAAR